MGRSRRPSSRSKRAPSAAGRAERFRLCPPSECPEPRASHGNAGHNSGEGFCLTLEYHPNNTGYAPRLCALSGGQHPAAQRLLATIREARVSEATR